MDFNFINFIFSANLLIKLITLVVIFFYTIFTFVVFTQVKVMTQILSLPYAESTLKIISIIHIALAISLFFTAVVIL